jgi:hypothetical protein
LLGFARKTTLLNPVEKTGSPETKSKSWVSGDKSRPQPNLRILLGF